MFTNRTAMFINVSNLITPRNDNNKLFENSYGPTRWIPAARNWASVFFSRSVIEYITTCYITEKFATFRTISLSNGTVTRCVRSVFFLSSRTLIFYFRTGNGIYFFLAAARRLNYITVGQIKMQLNRIFFRFGLEIRRDIDNILRSRRLGGVFFLTIGNCGR